MNEREAISELIAASARRLSREHYSDAQIEAAIAMVFGVDSNLIEDGTYFVAESAEGLIGCGGWSRRKNLFGGDQYSARDAGYLDPKSEPARIRAFFIHPAHARKGIARAILSRCETEALAHGFRALELMATLPGIAFYESCGFRKVGNYDLELTDDVKLELVPMRKELPEYAESGESDATRREDADAHEVS
jgi:GNAT superfamily N-acetyltransferase